MDRVIVRGVELIVQPYSPKRSKQIEAVQAEIDDYVEKNPGMHPDDVPSELKGKWWKAKGDILWRPAREGVELDIHFYSHEEFEVGTLSKVQSFFLLNEYFL